MEDINKDVKTVLIVDDEQAIIDVLKFNLLKEGYRTIEAKDGQTALEMALKERPNLIMLDIMLPKMDGLTVCQRVKSVVNIPIIILTAKDEEVDKIVGLELGADDYITKPFSVRELVARVKANIRKADDTYFGIDFYYLDEEIGSPWDEPFASPLSCICPNSDAKKSVK